MRRHQLNLTPRHRKKAGKREEKRKAIEEVRKGLRCCGLALVGVARGGGRADTVEYCPLSTLHLHYFFFFLFLYFLYWQRSAGAPRREEKRLKQKGMMKSISSVKQNLRGWRGTSTSSRRTNSFYPTPRATKGNGNDKGNYTTSAGDGGGDGGSDGGSTASESPSGSSPLVKLGKRVSKSFRERIAFPPMPPILTGNTPTGAEAASGEEQVMTSSKVESPPLLNWNLEELKLKEGMGFGFSAGGLLFPYFVGNVSRYCRPSFSSGSSGLSENSPPAFPPSTALLHETH